MREDKACEKTLAALEKTTEGNSKPNNPSQSVIRIAGLKPYL